MIRALPDLLSSSLFSRVTTDLKNDLDRAAIEAVTGRQSDVISAAGGRVGQVNRVQRVIDQSEATQTRLGLTAGRYNQASTVYEALRKGTENIGVDALKAAMSGDRTGVVASANTAQSTLGAAFTALNTRFDGRSLFAGNEGSNPALAGVGELNNAIDAIVGGAGTTADKMAAIDAYFAPGGGFDTDIYQGGTEDAAQVTLPGGFQLSSIERVDNSAFRDLIQGLTILTSSFKLPPQDIVDWVRQGANLIRSAQDELAVSEAQLGDTLNRIDEAVEREKDELVIASETLDRVVGRDAFEAASETQNIETRLQAAYTLTSRLGRLSLTNYLR